MLIALCTNEVERNNCEDEILRTCKTPDSFEDKKKVIESYHIYV